MESVAIERSLIAERASILVDVTNRLDYDLTSDKTIRLGFYLGNKTGNTDWTT